MSLYRRQRPRPAETIYRGEPWGRRLELHWQESSTPGGMGRFITAIWRRTKGTLDIAEEWGAAKGALLAWQASSDVDVARCDQPSRRTAELQMAAMVACNAYAAAAETWAKKGTAA